MPVSMDRFQPPSWNDELADCSQCYDRHHYTDLDDDGLCVDCRSARQCFCTNCENIYLNEDVDDNGVCVDCIDKVYGRFAVKPTQPLHQYRSLCSGSTAQPATSP